MRSRPWRYGEWGRGGSRSSSQSPLRWRGWGYGQFSQEAIWAATVTPGLTAGKTIVSMLPDWQKAITDYARSNGYEVGQ